MSKWLYYARSTELRELSSPARRFLYFFFFFHACDRSARRGNNTERNDNTLKVGCIASTDARLLCGGVDTNENKIRLFNRFVYVGRKEEVAATCFLDNIDELRFVNRQRIVFAVPSINPSLVEVNDSDFDVRALECNHSACRPA